MAETMVILGKRQRRFNGYDMVTGRLKYPADRVLPGMLYGKLKLSPYAHAEVVRFDTSQAKALPGVKAVITAQDVRDMPFARTPNIKVLTEKARRVNDPVAAVAATTLEIAQQAVDLIKVEYKVLTPIFDLDEALKSDSRIIHAGFKHEEGRLSLGNAEAGMKEADVVIDGDYLQDWISRNLPERTPALAEWHEGSDGGYLTIWQGGQGVHSNRAQIAEFLKIPTTRVRVVADGPTGGGFGGGGGYNSNVAIVDCNAALLSKVTGRPVMLVPGIDEDMCLLHARVPVYYDKFQMGCKKDGTITSLRVHSKSDRGSYAEPIYEAALFFDARRALRFDAFDYTYTGAYTNKLHGDSKRGVANTPSHLAVLLACDRMAEKLGMNPLDFYLKNAVKDGEKQGTNQPNAGCALTECLEKVAVKTNYRAKWHPPGQKTLPNGRKHGIAIVPFTHGMGAPASGAHNARVQIERDGSVHIYSGVHDQGQYTAEAMALIAAESFKISSLARITSVISDTDRDPYGPSSSASQVTVCEGTAVVWAVEDAKKKLFADAASILKVDASALATKEHTVYEIAKPENTKTFAQILAGAGRQVITGVGNPKWSAKELAIVFGGLVIELEVDPETGKVEITSHSVFVDTLPVNGMAFEGQFHGGAQQGLGYALYEGFHYDIVTGKYLNTNFLDHKTFFSMDMPPDMSVDSVGTIPNRLGPHGVKGIGEMTSNGQGPCVLNAIYNAIGVRFNHNCLTTRDILEGLGKV